MPIKTVGFIGLGVMGASMAAHLLGGGYELIVFNRTKEKAEPLLAKGAKWAETPAEVASGAEVVVTIVGYPKDGEDVYLGPNGILETKKGEGRRRSRRAGFRRRHRREERPARHCGRRRPGGVRRAEADF